MSDLREALDDLRRAIEDLPPSPTAADTGPLEKEARTLLTQSKNTPFEEEARELFGLLARLSAPGAASAESNQARSLLRRARIRVEIAGDDHDIDEAIDILAQALDLDPENSETHDLLMQAAGRSPQHAIKVQGLLERYGLDLEPPEEEVETPLVAVPVLPQRIQPPESAPSAQPGVAAPGPADAFLSEIVSAYYAGDYQRTVELANRLLAADPDNAQVAEYRQKAEDNLMRGIVPDHRIPFDARVAYNRANSLVRAGNYDEAQRLYREARDIAERAGIQSWKDVEQALLEIQDLALARELLADGDRLLAADDWSGALAKYEGALRVVPNDPEAEDRITMVQEVQHQFDQANVQLSMLSGSLQHRAKDLVELTNTVARLRQKLPGSERLQGLVYETNGRMQNVRTQLLAQADGALGRVEAVTSVEEKLRLADEASSLFKSAIELDPSDPTALASLQQSQQLRTDLNEGRQIMERAAALIAQNFDNELAQARQMLSGLRHQAQDPRYRMLVADLLSRHLERVEVALDRRDAATAERWLSICKEEPFRILGRRTEILRLEDEVRAMRQRRIIRRIFLLVVLVAAVGGSAFLSRDVWEPVINPPPTDTPTPSVTPTASATLTATSTATPTGSPTATSTATPEPIDQTATAAVTQTQIAGTEAAIRSFTLTAEARSAAQTATIRYLDGLATDQANATIVQSTVIARTEQAQATVNYLSTLTATFMPPTGTVRPTGTPTPTPTATTQLILCRVYNDDFDSINVRSIPAVEGDLVAQMLLRQAADVLEQRIGNDNRVWYKVKYFVRGSGEVVGWIRADLVVQQTTCPPLE